MKQILSALLALFTTQFSGAQTVSLDTAFGINGKSQNHFQGWQSGIIASKLQGDGKIVVCGYRSVYLTGDTDTILGRYNEDGTLDTGFGTSGFVIINDLFIDGTAPKSLMVQPDGKIVVTGANFFEDEGLNFYTYRFNPNGTPDITFGTNGVVTTDINSSEDEATTILLQPDNKLLVLGTYLLTGNIRHLCGVRYNVDGSIDTTFGTNGRAMFGSLAANYSNQLTDALLESNGKIVMGALHDIDGQSGNFVLAKFNANGTIDTGFGTNGARVTNFGGEDRLMSLQKINGKYYAFGYSENAENEASIAISRYSTAGALDSTFGTNGKVLLHRNATSTLDVVADARLVGDKIICVGYGEPENQTAPFHIDALLIRLNLDGSIDTTFNDTGYVITDFSNNNTDVFITLEIQPDGKILAQGSSTVSTDDSFIVARYQIAQLNTANFSSGLFTVYPNPVSNSLTIENKDLSVTNVTAELYDLSGRKLYECKLNGSSNSINWLNNLSGGNYLLRLTDSGKEEIIKIIKQ
jgi:uncharacterized delta-60 repeat protein